MTTKRAVEVKRWQRYKRAKGTPALLVLRVGYGRAVLLNERTGAMVTLAVASVARLHRLGDARPGVLMVRFNGRITARAAATLAARFGARL